MNVSEDTANNNVDENSNDHQYDEFAYYHNQFINHQYRNEHNPPRTFQNLNNSIPSQSLSRNGNSLPLANHTQSSSTSRIINLNRQNHDARFSNRQVSHRRNLSEDLSFNINSLPSLPPRNNSNEIRNRHQLLNPTHIPQNNWHIPLLHRQAPSDEEIRIQGEELLYNFVFEQFKNENLNPSQYLPSPNFIFPSTREIGRDLRLLADEFARSQERRELQAKAEQLSLTSMTCENFFQLCSELFCKDDKGITRERIVVLFTFICDIAIQHVKQRAERFLSQLMNWSIQFLYQYICAWVQEAGGWAAVLNRGASVIYNMTKFTLAVCCVVALGIFIRKNL